MWSKDILKKVLEEPNDKWNIKWMGIVNKKDIGFKIGDKFKYELDDEIIGIGEITDIIYSKVNGMHFQTGKFIFSVPTKPTDDKSDPVAILDQEIIILPKGECTNYKYNLFANGKQYDNDNPVKNLVVSECTDTEFNAYKLLR